MSALLVGYARCSTDQQDLSAQGDALLSLGVEPERIYVDHGMTGTNRERPGLREALAACRAGDTLVVTKLDRLARSLPDARAIADELTTRQISLSLGGSVYDLPPGLAGAQRRVQHRRRRRPVRRRPLDGLPRHRAATRGSQGRNRRDRSSELSADRRVSRLAHPRGAPCAHGPTKSTRRRRGFPVAGHPDLPISVRHLAHYAAPAMAHHAVRNRAIRI